MSSPFGLDAGDQLVELQREQPPVGAQLDDVARDLVGDPPHHLQALGDHGHVADGDQVLDLERGQRAWTPRPGGACSAPAWRAPGWPGRGSRLSLRARTGEPSRYRRDDAHRLAHRDHRVAGLPGHPLGGAVPGAGLLGRDRRVGHQVHGRPHDASPRRSRARRRRPSWTARAAGWPRTRTSQLEAAGADLVHGLVASRRTISAPVLPRRIRSSPSRSAVPGRERGQGGASGARPRRAMPGRASDRCPAGPWRAAPSPGCPGEPGSAQLAAEHPRRFWTGSVHRRQPHHVCSTGQPPKAAAIGRPDVGRLAHLDGTSAPSR